MTRDAPASSAYWIVGSDERMRVSSPITPFLIGTLKSTRTKTRRPCRFRSRMLRFATTGPLQPASGAGRRSGSNSPTRCRTRRAPSRSRRPSPWCTAHRRSTSAGCPGSRSTRARRRRRPGSPSAAPAAASRRAALTSSPVVFLSTMTFRSTTETFGVGTRMAKPSSFPFSSGSTSPTADAAPGRGRDHRQRRGARPPQVLVRQVEQVAGRSCTSGWSSSTPCGCRTARGSPWPAAPGSWSCTTRSR